MTEPKPMKLIFWKLCDADENEIKLIAAYYAAVFVHFRNEIWLTDIFGERLRTLNDQSGVALTLDQNMINIWRNLTGVEILRDRFSLNSSQQLKFCRTLLLNQTVVPTVDGIEYEFIYPYCGYFKHTQQENMSYE